MQKKRYILIICFLFILVGCSSNSNLDEKESNNEKKEVSEEKVTVTYSDEEKNMGVEERLNQLFNSIQKDKVISYAGYKVGENLVKNKLNHEMDKNWEITKENDRELLVNLNDELILEKYFTKSALKRINEQINQQDTQKDLIRYPMELFFLDWYQANYKLEIETKDDGIVLDSIPVEVVSFSGEDWNVRSVDSELDKTAKVKVTNPNLISLKENRKYSLDYLSMVENIKNKDLTNEILENLSLEGKESSLDSITANNQSIIGYELINTVDNTGELYLVVYMNKEDEVWKINSVEYDSYFKD